MNKFFIFLIALGVFFLLLKLFIARPIPQIKDQKITSIDTMKYSRDNAKNSNVLQDIPFYVKAIADLNATHVAIGTPYDEEFIPF